MKDVVGVGDWFSHQVQQISREGEISILNGKSCFSGLS